MVGDKIFGLGYWVAFLPLELTQERSKIVRLLGLAVFGPWLYTLGIVGLTLGVIGICIQAGEEI